MQTRQILIKSAGLDYATLLAPLAQLSPHFVTVFGAVPLFTDVALASALRDAFPGVVLLMFP